MIVLPYLMCVFEKQASACLLSAASKNGLTHFETLSLFEVVYCSFLGPAIFTGKLRKFKICPVSRLQLEKCWRVRNTQRLISTFIIFPLQLLGRNWKAILFSYFCHRVRRRWESKTQSHPPNYVLRQKKYKWGKMALPTNYEQLDRRWTWTNDLNSVETGRNSSKYHSVSPYIICTSDGSEPRLGFGSAPVRLFLEGSG